MSDKSSRFAGNSPALTGAPKMSAAAEARQLMMKIAGPLDLAAPIKDMVRKVATATGIGPRRLRGIWHQEAKGILAEEMDALRGASQTKQQAREAADRDEYRELVERLEFLERQMALVGPWAAGPAPYAQRAASSALGGVDRALGEVR